MIDSSFAILFLLRSTQTSLAKESFAGTLGGAPGTPIEEMEYDRLYVVTITDSGVSTVLLRFGARFEGH